MVRRVLTPAHLAFQECATLTRAVAVGYVDYKDSIRIQSSAYFLQQSHWICDVFENVEKEGEIERWAQPSQIIDRSYLGWDVKIFSRHFHQIGVKVDTYALKPPV